MDIHEQYMDRCLQLAVLGIGNVAPNPMVGAVLVHNTRIIGEGYHEKYGGPHAEVNCVNSVAEKDKLLISSSTLYVSLEPCNHYGKTPPCTNLIIENNVPHIVIGCSDPFAQVDGKGIKKLREAGISVTENILQHACKQLNKRFFTFHTRQRPYIILKWAQTANHIIASANDERLLISNTITNRLVHKWRSEEMGILVGTRTAVKDNPELTNRLWNGKSPVRLVIDKKLMLQHSLHIFNQKHPTVLFNEIADKEDGLVVYYKCGNGNSFLKDILHYCYTANIQSILVEGGASLLQSFINENLWDEARIITNENLFVPQGLAAPQLHNAVLQHAEKNTGDTIQYFNNNSHL